MYFGSVDSHGVSTARGTYSRMLSIRSSRVLLALLCVPCVPKRTACTRGCKEHSSRTLKRERVPLFICVCVYSALSIIESPPALWLIDDDHTRAWKSQLSGILNSLTLIAGQISVLGIHLNHSKIHNRMLCVNILSNIPSLILKYITVITFLCKCPIACAFSSFFPFFS